MTCDVQMRSLTSMSFGSSFDSIFNRLSLKNKKEALDYIANNTEIIDVMKDKAEELASRFNELPSSLDPRRVWKPRDILSGDYWGRIGTSLTVSSLNENGVRMKHRVVGVLLPTMKFFRIGFSTEILEESDSELDSEYMCFDFKHNEFDKIKEILVLDLDIKKALELFRALTFRESRIKEE